MRAAPLGTRPRRRLVPLGFSLLVVLAPLAIALPGTSADGGGDHFTPSSVTLYMGQGSSTTVAKTLHLDALPKGADVEIAVDTTGSMAPSIAQAQADATNIVNTVKASISDAQFAVVDFKDFVDGTDLEYRVKQTMTADPALVQSAINTLGAAGGGDAPEAYNLVFHNSYADGAPALGWRTNTRKFVVVIGDASPHGTAAIPDGATAPTFPDCAASSDTTDPHGFITATELAGMKAAQRTLLMIRQVSSFTSASLACYQSLVAAAAPVGKAVDGGDTGLGQQIIDLVKEAAARISHVELSVQPAGESSWIELAPPSFGDTGSPLVAPLDLSFTETIRVPAGTPEGTHHFTVHAIADGVDRASEDITVNVRRQAVSNVALSVDESSIPAGIARVPLAKIPAARLAFLAGNAVAPPTGSVPAGSIPAGSIPAGSIPAGSIPAGSIPAGSIPAGSIPAGSIPASITFGQAGLGSAPAGSIPAGSIALQRILLSSIPLLNPATGASWDQVLLGTPLAGRPLNALTLADVAANATALSRLNALRLRDVGLSGGLLGGVRFASLLLGNATLSQLPPPGGAASWCIALTNAGGSCTGLDTSHNTVLGVELAGQLGATDVGSIPAGSIPAGSIPAGSIPAGSINIPATRLGPVLLSTLSSLSTVVNCSAVDCTAAGGKTLGDAYTANAIQSTATLATLLASLPAGSIARQITIGELIAALAGIDFPWESVAIQGLQDVAGTGDRAHYHVDFDFDCSITSSFAVSVKLPEGFFPVAGTSQFSYGTGAPLAAVDPSTPDPNVPFTFAWSTLPPDPCAGGTATRHVRLDFSAYAGLTLGVQRGSAGVTANGLTQTVSDQAPITVVQNNESNNDPGTAPVVAKDTLIVEHIPSAGDVANVRFKIDGLPVHTRVTAYLKVPQGADFDLAINKPEATSFQSLPAGSIPAGSIPIEDGGQTLDNTGAALPPETLQDIPAAAPAGSIPAGSIPAGSISANRGSVTERATVVLTGESGYLTIGASSYNGSFSANPAVLRIAVTPPPPLPPCLARTFPNPTPAANALPASLPASTKTIFVVNRQRLVSKYGATDTSALLSAIGDQATPGSFAARPEVMGSVLQVDGSTPVRDAYTAWDANPCSTQAANDVVTKINTVIGGYRTQPGGLPNLTYIVLLGSDEAVPMFRQADLATVSPELDEAGDLAFTTNSLTQGNALYASAAQDNVLTDGAYGALTKLTWLGHDLPLAQLSVSRLVESSADMKAQIDQYVDPAVNGTLDPTTSTTTGYDFLTEGSTDITNSIASNFPGITRSDLLPPTVPDWDKIALLGTFFNATVVPDIGSLNAHYSHYLAQPASVTSGLASTANVPASLAARILWTMGCHGGLNVDNMLGGDSVKLKDWAQAYMQARAAVYVANSGFGYGETTPGLSGYSERLMALFGAHLNSDGRSIGQQWTDALGEYYLSPGAYDVYDEKVMLEATFYGLPFWHFAHPGSAAVGGGSGLVTHDDGGGLQAASVTVTPNAVENTQADGRSFWSSGGHTDDTLYRSVQPLVSRNVTVPGMQARGVFLTSLTTADHANQKPVVAYPAVDLAAHEPQPNFQNIFFPANVVKLARTSLFGQERDAVQVTAGQFRPDPGTDHGVERIVVSLGADVAYSSSADSIPPLISQVGAVMTSGSTATIFADAADVAGPLHKVAALYNDGAHNWQYVQLQLVGSLWQANVTGLAAPPEVLAEAQDGAGNVAYSANKGFNFTAFSDTGGPSVLIQSPSPNAVYQLNQKVAAHFACSDAGGVKSCSGTVPDGAFIDTSTVGKHDFTVTATDLSNNTVVKTISYFVRFVFAGFYQPVSNPPMLNVASAGQGIPLKWSLKDAAGGYTRNLAAITSISSSAIKCPTAATEPVPDSVVAGTSSLKYDTTLEQYVFNWQTNKAWAGTCRRLFLALSDTTVQTADFQFK